MGIHAKLIMKNCLNNIKESVGDGLKVMLSFIVLLLFVYVLCSCSSKRHIVETNTKVEQSMKDKDSVIGVDIASVRTLSEMREYIRKAIGGGEVFLYDTSLAIDTGGGFYAPVLAHVSFEHQTESVYHKNKDIEETTEIAIKDSVSNNEVIFTKENNDKEEKSERGSGFFNFTNGMIVGMLILVLLLLFIFIRKR